MTRNNFGEKIIIYLHPSYSYLCQLKPFLKQALYHGFIKPLGARWENSSLYVEKLSVLLIGSSSPRELLNVLFLSSVSRTCPMKGSPFLQKRKMFCLSFRRHDIFFVFFFSITEKSKRQITNSKKKRAI